MSEAAAEDALTPRQLAVFVAGCAAGAAAVPIGAARYLATARGARCVDLGKILDLSPDLPASAIVKHFGSDLPIAAAEAFKAAYVGMAPWVKGEEEKALEAARQAKLAEKPDRPSRYEKTGRGQIKAGEKIGRKN